MKVYDFSVSDAFDKSIDEIWEVARHSVRDQEDFEIACGGDPWPPFQLVLAKIVPVDPNTTRYHFEAWISEASK
jgi:hypothetical protein